MGEYIYIIIHSKSLTSEILTLSFIPPVVGQAYFGRVTSRIGGKNTTILTGILSIVFFATFLYSSNIIAEVLLYSLFNLVAFTGFPVLLGFVAQQISGRTSGLANSMVWGVGNTVGGATGIGMITALVLYISLYNAFWIMVLFGLASLPVLVMIKDKPTKADYP
jgi:FSR family fosmidomycin resistance protein-like MFS transporter